MLGLNSYNNYGVSGYTTENVYSKVNSVTDTADVIFVMCGVNDQTFHVPLETISDTTTGTTYGNLNLLCAKLKEKYPTKLVVFITPHYQTNYPHNDGITSYEISKAIKEVCEKYAIVVYDNFAISKIYFTNLSYWTTDNCHWNDKAYEMLGRNLAKFMMDTFKYYYGYVEEEEEEPEVTVTLSSITATFNQGSNVIYNTDSLETLKQYLTVTATYSDGSTLTVTSYSLSGTFTTGNSTITASYGGKTITFNVTVTYNDEAFIIINNSLDSVTYENNILTMTGKNQTFPGAIFNNVTSVEVDIDTMLSYNSLMFSDNRWGWFIVRDGDIYHAIGGASGKVETYDFDNTLTTATNQNNSYGLNHPSTGTLSVKIESDGVHMYFDAEKVYSTAGDAIGYIPKEASKVIHGISLT